MTCVHKGPGHVPASGVAGGCVRCYWAAYVLPASETRSRYMQPGADAAVPGKRGLTIAGKNSRAGREAAARRARAIELLAAGATDADICTALGVRRSWLRDNRSKHVEIRLAHMAARGEER